MLNFHSAICSWISITSSLQITEGVKVSGKKQGNSETGIYLPTTTASPEFMVMEEIWNMAKRDLLVLKYYSSFADFKEKMSFYFRTKRFNLDMGNYLLRNTI
jgi:hypothetical protein